MAIVQAGILVQPGDTVYPAAESSVSAFTCEFLLNCLIMLPGQPEKCGLCAAACSFAALLARTAASSYAAASLSTNEIAL